MCCSESVCGWGVDRHPECIYSRIYAFVTRTTRDATYCGLTAGELLGKSVLDSHLAMTLVYLEMTSVLAVFDRSSRSQTGFVCFEMLALGGAPDSFD